MSLKIVSGIGVVLIILAAMIGCEGDMGPAGPQGGSGEASDPAAYSSANGYLGGAAYSKWWTTDAGGSGDLTNAAGSDFARCKACHAWDGLGNAASYSNRTGHSTGKSSRPDVSSVNLRSRAASTSANELYALVEHAWGRPMDAASNEMPNYKSSMTEEQLWNIVKFMKEEWIEPSELYDLTVTGPPISLDSTPTLVYTNIGMGGNASSGDALAASNCAACHGTDGKKIEVGGKSGIGKFVRDKPNEAWFKVKFGEAGTGMNPGQLLTSTADMKDLYKALTNTTSYPD